MNGVNIVRKDNRVAKQPNQRTELVYPSGREIIRIGNKISISIGYFVNFPQLKWTKSQFHTSRSTLGNSTEELDFVCFRYSGLVSTDLCCISDLISIFSLLVSCLNPEGRVR